MAKYYWWTGILSSDIGVIGNYVEDAGPAGNFSGPGQAATALPMVGDYVFVCPPGLEYGLGLTYGTGPTGGASGAQWTFTAGASGGPMTFDAAVQVTGGSSVNGNFNADVRVSDGGYATGVANGRYIVGPNAMLDTSGGLVLNCQISLNDGNTWLYSPNAPGVAPASAVKAGVVNLGVVGTLKASGLRVIGGLGVQ